MTTQSSYIFRYVEEHIGQVKLTEADSEIERLNKQTGKIWIKDFSKYLSDDSDNPYGPAELSEGYCWIVLQK